ncbi:CheR family methyltransferase [Planktothrix paucivesiculata]|uniref:protein-glutamate O-methyltransferase n=1 Tax=Planktothrix paucivesiculata PCC 9631 TaxID=671071 RepID=A0A7Z9BSR6_9CYAN|nr:CheR family methyltransferase [Planktothrix paucivesiculata]VXD21651.1 Chemotaxis protein methyltransferase [Planktothrix paucivesiculata PCC 9631]
MEPELIKLFINLITSQTGLFIRLQDYGILAEKIKIRVKSLKLPDPQVYLNLLSSDTSQSREEWKQLIPLITTIETYFFRDQGQINLLRTIVLPELIASRQHTKKLTLWSAGCSTGEEPYTLSILLQQLIPDWGSWNLQILGTDVNEEALKKASQGLYTAWSFRMVDLELRNRYFVRQREDWKINSLIQSPVKFFNLNLVKDSYCYPDYTPIQDVDLIICRNVFVYFEKYYINQVVSKFFDVLKPGGYLITGHAELQGTESIEKFQSKIYPESMIYQRSIGLFKESLTLPKNLISNRDHRWDNLLYSARNHQEQYPKINKQEHHQSEVVKLSQKSLEEAKRYFKNKQYQAAIQKAEQFIQMPNYYLKNLDLTIAEKKERNENYNQKSANNFDAYYLLAQAWANLGEYEQAISYCKKAIEIDSLSILPYYLLLHIAQEQEDLVGAKLLSKRIIYLLPSSIPAYLELASIYEQEKDHTRAAKMYSTALSLLKSLPPTMRIEHWEGVMAKDLIVFLENKHLAIDC